MNMSKEKKKEIILQNFDIIKDNYNKNGSEFCNAISKMIAIDKETAIDMWLFLLKKHESELKSDSSYKLTTQIVMACDRVIGEESIEKIVLETPEIKKAYFALMSQHVALYCGSIISKEISKNELKTANELLDLVYNNPHREDSWYKIMDMCMPDSDQGEVNSDAVELLEMWCDKVEDEEERAKLSLKMLAYYD